MQAAADAQTPSSSSVRGGLKSKCTRAVVAAATPARSTSQKAPRRLPAPKRRSWSYSGRVWPLRSMWNSLPCHSAWAMPCGEVQAGHLLVADLGVDADQLGALQRR